MIKLWWKKSAKAIIRRFNKQIREKIGTDKLAILEKMMVDIIGLSEQNNLENHQSD